MSTAASPIPGAAAPPSQRSHDRRRSLDRFGDAALHWVCVAAALLAVVVLIGVAYQVVHGASPSISKFGLGFVIAAEWQPNFGVFGAGPFLFGTLVTSFFALLIGGPIAIAIGLFLSLLAPKR